ncbi:hypothetical protein F0P96_00540 [Hymenobacter busanensis]|uniref:Uncharacterized protein n=1 Tax=Hymenobacter busanensis TaxID=2607656 RepID=A0A7L4ZVS5_9BACT|nr:hypothetical protein [Hymenobacter busanensis]KAA9339155.1 hypothetical protein F0P96_00540 [Hymenobacter busanensis]QHJ07083.1 hypothetical protein GUY19_07210 [Hymenobacter busanensis]
MSYTPHPENMRAPGHLSPNELRQALDELDAKIKTLNARANATTADSPHHYHEHAAALEAKRSKLAEQLGSTADDAPGSVWSDIKRGIDVLRQDISKFI